jgi:hypothetical protein
MSRDKFFSALFGALLIALVWIVLLIAAYFSMYYLTAPISKRTQIIEGTVIILLVPMLGWLFWSRLLKPRQNKLRREGEFRWLSEDVRGIILALTESEVPMTVAQLASKTGQEPVLVVDALNIVYQDGNLLCTRGYWNYHSALTDGQGYSAKSEAAAYYRSTQLLGSRSR